MKKIRIAIIATGLVGWGGGIDFLIDFLKVFENKRDRYSFEIYLKKRSAFEIFVRKICNKNISSDERLRNRLVENCKDVLILDYKCNIFGRCQNNIKKIAILRKIDILIPMNSLINNLKDPHYLTLSYITDLQHKYMPELFSEKEIKSRDLYFYNLLRLYDFSFTQSYSTKNDLLKYYGKIAESVYVMYAYPHRFADNCSSENTRLKYDLVKPYFIVCNQFWMHKNHKLVFDAFNIFFERGNIDFYLVCTGDTEDYRNPSYFQDLTDYLSKLSCKNNIKILGYLKKEEQINLLRNSITLIQPTLFEGNPGGGAVVDAKAYGVPCIVSDIDVNKEIPTCFGDNDTMFFDRNNPTDLANCMEISINKYNPNVPYKCNLNYENFYKNYDKVFSDMINKFFWRINK